jgi:hypothetical protein
MKDINEVQLAWRIVELLEAITDLIWDHYENDFRIMRENQKSEDAWAE